VEHEASQAFEDAAAEDFVVVGVGASAVGLEAFQELVAKISPQHDRAYVLIQHLDPDHDSLLPELLARRARVPVVPIREGMALEAGRVYLIPPGATLKVEKRVLRLFSFDMPRGNVVRSIHFSRVLRRTQGRGRLALS
jgi:two-component system CheB/CheR fusion protein